MLYLDASALVKRYVRERGSVTLNARFRKGDRIFTSILSEAEVQSALGRKYQRGELPREAYDSAQEKFVLELIYSYSVLALDTGTLAAVRSLVERFPITGADAVHLSAAIWLRDMCQLVPSFAPGEKEIEFGVADKQLADFARDSGLKIFNPEELE